MNHPVPAFVGEPKPEKESRPRVLAVDDQADSLRLLQLRLEAGGMECICFPDGASALEFLEGQLVDVVILDVMMPRMDGYEVCRHLKASERTRDIPVIFLTAKFEASDKVQGLEVGGHDYLTKPVQQAELLARTRAALRVKQLQDQLKAQLRLQQEIHQLHRGMLSEHWQKTLGQLAASLAHEINNPLAAALGTVQLLEMQLGLDDRLQQSLNVVDRSLQRAGQKLRSLLLIAQVSRQPQRVELARLIEDLVTLLNYQAVVSKVKLETVLDPACRWHGVPGDLGRAILYVLDNAVEAVTGKIGAEVRIVLRPEGSEHCIAITDNGGGVPAPVLGRIFEPFFTTKGPPHHGVGLYLADEILKAMGGRIAVQSPAGAADTQFTIRVPASSDDMDAP